MRYRTHEHDEPYRPPLWQRMADPVLAITLTIAAFWFTMSLGYHLGAQIAAEACITNPKAYACVKHLDEDAFRRLEISR